MKEWLNLVRGLVRPLLTFGVVGLLAALAYRLALQFANESLATQLIGFLAGAGTMAFGYWFGERKTATK